MAHADCPLCQKVQRRLELPPGEFVWEFPHSVAFLGPWQYFHGYCVLVAREHETELHHLRAGVRGAFFEEMCLLARAIEECFQPRKLNCESLGNQVAHLHWHIFPRYAHDPGHLQAAWLALDRAERDPNDRQRLQAGPIPRLDTIQLLQRKLEQFRKDEG